MAKLIFLGTSASIPTKKRDNTSFVFSYRQNKFLIDCPGSIYQKLLKADLGWQGLDKVIITHHHPDHIYGVISLLHCRFLLDKSPLYIFSNQTCIKLIKKTAKLFSLVKRDRPALHYIDVFSKSFFYKTKEVKMKAVRNRHIKDSFGIYIKLPRKNLFYSSDTSFIPSVIKKLMPLDYLIHDCTASSYYFNSHPSLYNMHTSSLQLKNFLEKEKKTKLIPLHFLLLEKGEMKKIKKELESVEKKVIYPEDFSRLKV
ncbi:MAG: MBL fold metallo-hydrolase [Candidatus Omnitrophica bacterium]|nr:MBL fold metallo-hydrolase [Candidatus Omnitrophota bacterium]MBD3269176.1 MBL fold metallo-hydrolase [Candidatus Omnitrophota bacterium]